MINVLTHTHFRRPETPVTYQCKDCNENVCVICRIDHRNGRCKILFQKVYSWWNIK